MRRFYILPFIVAVLMTACASPKEESGTVSQQANANTAPGPVSVAQSNNVPPPGNSQPPQIMPNPAPSNTQPVPLPEVAKITENKPKPEDKADEPVAENGPKLLVTSTEMDFGKQPGDVELTRTILIKNTGKADLEIQSVSPS